MDGAESRRFLALLTVSIGLAGLLAADPVRAQTCTSSAANVKLTPEEVANLKYIRENSAIGIPHKLNLADDRQYAHVLATLRRAGHTAEKSPHLFRLLEETRAQGRPGKPVPVAESTGLTLQGINYVTEFGPQSDGSYFANGYSTYPADQVPYYTLVIVTLIDTSNNNTVITSQSDCRYSQTNLQVAATGTPAGSTDDVEVNALMLVAPQKGDPVEPYNVVLTDLEEVSGPCQTSPNFQTPATGTQNCGTSTGTACAAQATSPITVCYGNRIQSNCDYGCTGSSYPPNIIFPIVGSVDLGETPITPLSGSLYIILKDTTGGGCVLKAASNSTAVSQLLTANGTTVSWNLAPASFKNENCVKPNGMTFNYSFQVYLQTTGGNAGVTFTSDTSQQSLPNTVIVPTIEVLQGCLPAGVKIRMADGSERAIETFQAYGDETVRSAGAATVRAVTGNTWGREEKPLIRIVDDLGHTLLLTEEHPVITRSGPVAAKRLVRGDVVLTENGPSTLIEVARHASAQPVPVHNLRVGTEEEAAAGESTFFANGILVGDQLMQRHLMLEAAKPEHLSKEEILQRLPPEWHQDFLNTFDDAR